jgi:hypothetical protein
VQLLKSTFPAIKSSPAVAAVKNTSASRIGCCASPPVRLFSIEIALVGLNAICHHLSPSPPSPPSLSLFHSASRAAPFASSKPKNDQGMHRISTPHHLKSDCHVIALCCDYDLFMQFCFIPSLQPHIHVSRSYTSSHQSIFHESADISGTIKISETNIAPLLQGIGFIMMCCSRVLQTFERIYRASFECSRCLGECRRECACAWTDNPHT